MILEIKKIAILVAVLALFSCSGSSNTSSDPEKEPPGPVTEMDRSRYNLNAPDEMLQEMQDSTAMDTTENEVMPDTLID